MIPFPELLSDPSPAIGTFIQSASPEFLEASAYAGFRFAAIDLEHASFGTETLVHLIRAGEAAGLSMLARVPGLDAALIKKSLDMGAAGIIVPNIDTPEQAAEAVALCRFTPEGIRGACPGVRANRYGAGGPEYYENANLETVVIPLIESPAGIENFAAILSVPGISGAEGRCQQSPSAENAALLRGSGTRRRRSGRCAFHGQQVHRRTVCTRSEFPRLWHRHHPDGSALPGHHQRAEPNLRLKPAQEGTGIMKMEMN